MRIISGISKGIPLKAPEGLSTRPTTDRVKENIFNLIQFDVPSSKVLDLFAGSGAMGIEALSRGADKLISVDNSSMAIKVINENLLKSNLADKAQVLQLDMEIALNRISTGNNADKFNLIFADPPYSKQLCDKVLKLLIEYELLDEDAIIVLEHSKDDIISFDEDEFYLERQKIYGNIAVSIYRRETL